MEPDKDFNLTVGMRIREIREASNMTRAEFSEKCDISESFLAAVEIGKKSITSKTLYKICTTTDVSADYFIRGRKKASESNTFIELVSSLDKPYQDALFRMVREYVGAVNFQPSPEEK